jgi:hypothetical protein
MAFNLGAAIGGAAIGAVAGMRFPSDIDGNLPTITFSARPAKGGGSHGAVTLYMPPSVAINDGAGYSELQLGMFGADGMLAAAADLASGTASKEQLERMANTATGANQQDQSISKLIGLEALNKFGLGGTMSERARDLGMYQKGKVLNPNTVLKYDGPALRDFSFTFNLVPKSSGEANTLKIIHRWFRVLMHPEREGNGVLLGYPDIFNISFRNGGMPNLALPTIKDCYCTGLSYTANPNGNAYHSDGSPNEVTLTVTFRETRQNSRADVLL